MTYDVLIDSGDIFNPSVIGTIEAPHMTAAQSILLRGIASGLYPANAVLLESE